MNISSMYVKRGLAHLFSNTSKSTKKIDTLDKKIQAATPCSRYCSSRWSFLFLLSSFVVNVAAPHSEKAFCSKLNPDVCDSTLWALLMSFIWATAICPCHYFCCFRITVQYIVNTEFLENGSTTIEKIRKKNDLYFWQWHLSRIYWMCICNPLSLPPRAENLLLWSSWQKDFPSSWSTDRTTLKIHSILGNAMGSKKCDYPTLFGTILSVFSQEAVIIVRFSFLPPLLLPPFERQHKESIVKMHFLQIISNWCEEPFL